MGVKKSTVCTRARCRSRRYTPASSKVFELTSTLRSNEMGSCGKTCRRACWLNLEAHPAQDESEVSLRICSRDIGSPPFPLRIADCGLSVRFIDYARCPRRAVLLEATVIASNS